MAESSPNCTQEAFSKFLNKAKKKLNKKEEEVVEVVVEVEPEKEQVANYHFEKSTKSEDKKRLETKIKSLLATNPDTPYPIEFLIDHKVYDKLTDEAKTKYILQLSRDYVEIRSKL